MPGHAHIDATGLLQHVIVRGIEKRSIFLDDQDREDFLARFPMLLNETTTDCYAWTLLGIGTRRLITEDEVLPFFSSERKKVRSKYFTRQSREVSF